MSALGWAATVGLTCLATAGAAGLVLALAQTAWTRPAERWRGDLFRLPGLTLEATVSPQVDHRAAGSDASDVVLQRTPDGRVLFHGGRPAPSGTFSDADLDATPPTEAFEHGAWRLLPAPAPAPLDAAAPAQVPAPPAEGTLAVVAGPDAWVAVPALRTDGAVRGGAVWWARPSTGWNAVAAVEHACETLAAAGLKEPRTFLVGSCARVPGVLRSATAWVLDTADSTLTAVPAPAWDSGWNARVVASADGQHVLVREEADVWHAAAVGTWRWTRRTLVPAVRRLGPVTVGTDHVLDMRQEAYRQVNAAKATWGAVQAAVAAGALGLAVRGFARRRAHRAGVVVGLLLGVALGWLAWVLQHLGGIPMR